MKGPSLTTPFFDVRPWARGKAEYLSEFRVKRIAIAIPTVVCILKTERCPAATPIAVTKKTPSRGSVEHWTRSQCLSVYDITTVVCGQRVAPLAPPRTVIPSLRRDFRPTTWARNGDEAPIRQRRYILPSSESQIQHFRGPQA